VELKNSMEKVANILQELELRAADQELPSMPPEVEGNQRFNEALATSCHVTNKQCIMM